jgi:hypothetical protein
MLELPAYAAAVAVKHALLRCSTPSTATPIRARPKGYAQQSTRYLVQNPPQPYLTQANWTRVRAAFTRDVHPFYAQQGAVREQTPSNLR